MSSKNLATLAAVLWIVGSVASGYFAVDTNGFSLIALLILAGLGIWALRGQS